MKYIVLKRKVGDGLEQEIPVIFPEVLTHLEVALGVISACDEFKNMRSVQFIKEAAISAGFVSCMDFDQLHCHGRSESLGKGSRKEVDSALIQLIDYSGGIVP